jgi:hypothetical protein
MEIEPMNHIADDLYVIAVYMNPMRYRTRDRLFRDFMAHTQDLAANVLIVEIAFGKRPFEVTTPNNAFHLQLRTDKVLWLKENAVNLGIAHLRRVRPSAKYVAWVDGDVMFQRRDIIRETVEQLQHYVVVQMFSHAVDLGPQGQNIRNDTGFMYQYHQNGMQPPTTAKGRYPQGPTWHPGYAWAARIAALDKLPGPLFDQGILGSSDQHMAKALVGRAGLSIPKGISAGYRNQVENWGAMAELHLRRNVGYVPGLITHHWHGDKANRKYVERWDVLISTQFDPTRDLMRDTQGLYRLADFLDERSRRLHDLVLAYFGQRDEDSTYLHRSVI